MEQESILSTLNFQKKDKDKDFKTVFVFVLAQLEGLPQKIGESGPKPPKRPFRQISFIFIITWAAIVCVSLQP